MYFYGYFFSWSISNSIAHYSGKKLPPLEVDGLEKKQVWKWHGLSNQMGVCIGLGGDLGVL